MDNGQMPYEALGHSGVTLDLVALLDARRDEVATAWAEVIRREMPDTYYGRRSIEEIEENNRLSLDLLKDLLRGTDSVPSQWGELLRVSAYLQEGLRVGDILSAARLLGQVLVPIVGGAFPSTGPCRSEAMLRLEAGLDRFVALVVEFIAVRITKFLEEQHRRTELMLETARAVSTSLELEDVLRLAAKGVASAVGADHSSICLIEEGGTTGTLWPAADQLSPAVARYVGPTGQRVVLLREGSLTRRVLDEKRPIVWPDVQDDPAVEDDLRALGLRTVLGVPCAVNERPLGVVFVMTFDAPCTFTTEQIELAAGVANVVAPAIENARLHHRVEQLAIVEERARLAQEIHDDLAQTLTAMQFYASVTGDLLARQELSPQQLTQAQAGMSVLRDLIGQTCIDVREAIFGLRSVASLQGGGLPALKAYLARYAQRYGLAVQLQADDQAAAVLAGDTGLQVFRILQEALANVRKHGHPPCARVDLQRQDAWVCLSVQDDGPGFDPASAGDQNPPRFGLQVMRERAEKVGGTLRVESQPGQGTRVLLRVPYPKRSSAA